MTKSLIELAKDCGAWSFDLSILHRPEKDYVFNAPIIFTDEAQLQAFVDAVNEKNNEPIYQCRVQKRYGWCDMSDVEQEQREARFRSELQSLLNKHSRENESNTPDYIQADYLIKCLYELKYKGLKIMLGDVSDKFRKFFGDNSQPYLDVLNLELEIAKLRQTIVLTLEQNGHLADGDNCSLIELKKAIGAD